MRRALQTLDPRKSKDIAPEYRKLVRNAILQSFYAIRETFLEELDLEQPVHPLLISGGRRLKSAGQTAAAKKLQARQREGQDKAAANGTARREEVDALLADLHQREQNGA